MRCLYLSIFFFFFFIVPPWLHSKDSVVGDQADRTDELRKDISAFLGEVSSSCSYSPPLFFSLIHRLICEAVLIWNRRDLLVRSKQSVFFSLTVDSIFPLSTEVSRSSDMCLLPCCFLIGGVVWGDFLSPSFRLEPERPSTFASSVSSSSLKRPAEQAEGFRASLISTGVSDFRKPSSSSTASPPEDLLTSSVLQDNGGTGEETSYASSLIPRLVHKPKGSW